MATLILYSEDMKGLEVKHAELKKLVENKAIDVVLIQDGKKTQVVKSPSKS